MAIASLCLRAIEGDLVAEATLIRLILPKIKELLFRIVWDKDSIDDLLQDTLELATMKLRAKAVQRPEMFLAFVRGIARNLVVTHIRSRQRDAGSLSIDELGDHTLLEDDDATEPLGELLHAESAQSMLALIAQLPRRRDRRVLIGHHFEGLSPGRMARELNLKEAHFYRVLHRARQRLGRLILALPPDERPDC